ncbi:MAG: Glu-tRNA(Gln) amidotransferase subunit GatD [Candidatus Korarchaeota archaeon]
MNLRGALDMYAGKAKELLEREGVSIWDKVVVSIGTTAFEAIILPGPVREDVIYLKLPNGYNLAVKVDRIKSIKKIATITPKYTLPKMLVTAREDLPEVSIIHCGGTIASRIEYTTGAVAPAFSAEELSNAIPELFSIIKPRLTMLFNIFSENMTPKHWIEIAKTTYRELLSGAKSVIITHGTDTLHYSAAALAFMLRNLKGPVVLTGAMRSSDRPASDAPTNLIASSIFATKSDVGEPVILMHGTPDDTCFFAHRGVRCIKLHSTRRDAFRSIGIPPIARVDIREQKVDILYPHHKKTTEIESELKAVFEPKTAIIFIYPGMPQDIIDSFTDRNYRGLVLVGTGLGHVPEYMFESIQRAIENGIIVVMTTQCLLGGVYLDVYETGRKLKTLGVVSGRNMLPHVAYIKLGWLLAQDIPEAEVKDLMGKNITGEIVYQESPVYF